MRAAAPASPPHVERLGAADRDTLVAAMAAVTGLLGGGEAPWHIRTFRAGDLALIASRQSILYEAYGWGRPMEILQGEVTTAFLRDFKPGREQCWVAERAGLMAGAVMLVDAGDDVGQLRLLHVEPWARGLGIGSALVAECVKFAREAGYAKIRLWTHTVLASARRIYEARASGSSKPRSTTSSASPSRAKPGSLTWRSHRHLEADLHRGGAALVRAMIDRLDIVAVGIEQEGGVIAGMIGPLAGRAIVGAAGRQPRLVEGLDHRLVLRLESAGAWGRSACLARPSLSAVEIASSSAPNMPSASKSIGMPSTARTAS